MPLGNDAGFTTMDGQSITRFRLTEVEQLFASTIPIVIGNVPVCVGVPERVFPEKVIPVGRVPVSDHTTGSVPLVCVNACEYAVPATPFANVFGAITICGNIVTTHGVEVA